MMRSKEEILKDSLDGLANSETWQAAILQNDLQKIEVFIDIRDLISSLTTILASVEKIAYRAG